MGGAAGVVSGGGLPSERRWRRCSGVEAVFPDFAVVVEMSSGLAIVLTDQRKNEDFFFF
jgi:hypothetical protein